MPNDREDVGDVTYITNSLHGLGLSTDSIISALNLLKLDPKSRWKNIPKVDSGKCLVTLIEEIGKDPDCELILHGCTQVFESSINPTIKK